jgi:hypothetical protein
MQLRSHGALIGLISRGTSCAAGVTPSHPFGGFYRGFVNVLKYGGMTKNSFCWSLCALAEEAARTRKPQLLTEDPGSGQDVQIHDLWHDIA